MGPIPWFNQRTIIKPWLEIESTNLVSGQNRSQQATLLFTWLTRRTLVWNSSRHATHVVPVMQKWMGSTVLCFWNIWSISFCLVRNTRSHWSHPWKHIPMVSFVGLFGENWLAGHSLANLTICCLRLLWDTMARMESQQRLSDLKFANSAPESHLRSSKTDLDQPVSCNEQWWKC